MIVFLKRLWFGCLFSHDRYPLRVRLGDGSYAWQCPRCGGVDRMLTTEIIRGPKSQADRVLGAPRVKVSTGLKVTSFAGRPSRRA